MRPLFVAFAFASTPWILPPALAAQDPELSPPPTWKVRLDSPDRGSVEDIWYVDQDRRSRGPRGARQTEAVLWVGEVPWGKRASWHERGWWGKGLAGPKGFGCLGRRASGEAGLELGFYPYRLRSKWSFGTGSGSVASNSGVWSRNSRAKGGRAQYRRRRSRPARSDASIRTLPSRLNPPP